MRFRSGFDTNIVSTAMQVQLSRMFAVTDAEARMIRAAYHEGGELAGAVELRRLYPGLRIDTHQARTFARTIAGWPSADDPEPPLAA